MFETAELGQKVTKAEFKEREPILRTRLLEAQARLADAGIPVIVIFSGVDGAGKGETVNLLSEWMDPRRLVTKAYGSTTREERERPRFWRYWRDLPPKGRIGFFLSAWYHRPLIDRVYDKMDDAALDERLDEIVDFERSLARDGALILKFWMHLGKSQQKRRLRSLEKDPLQKWRVTENDWKHWRLYDEFIKTSEHIIMRTSTGLAGWRIVEGMDPHYRSLRVSTLLLEALLHRLDRIDEEKRRSEHPIEAAVAAEDDDEPALSPEDALGLAPEGTTVLDRLDLTSALTKGDYKRRLAEGQMRLNKLYRDARERGISTLLVFEGWDAGGKGGAIRRVTRALDARDYEVISIAAPTDEERAQHYLWRFWRHLPRAGRVTIFDRSWYGRVLVERVEGFATVEEWRRAYAEINRFEEHLVGHGTVLLKFWLHISPEEQEARFQARAETPHKRWKLTDEDWRNREQWTNYEHAVHDMVERTSTRTAPWLLIEGNDKMFARVKVLESVCDALHKRLKDR